MRDEKHRLDVRVRRFLRRGVSVRYGVRTVCVVSLMYVYEVTMNRPNPSKPNRSMSHTTYVVAERAADVRAWIAGGMSKSERATLTKWLASQWSWVCKSKHATYRIAKMDADAFGASPVIETATVCPSTRKVAAK